MNDDEDSAGPLGAERVGPREDGLQDVPGLLFLMGAHHLHDIGRRAADVALCFDVRAAVHIAHHRGVGMLALQLAQSFRGYHVRHPAACVQHREEHALVRIQDGCALGHEVHPAEHDDLGVGLLGHPAQAEAVPDEIGNLVDLWHLVVVAEDDGVALLLEADDIALQPGVAARLLEEIRDDALELQVPVGSNLTQGALPQGDEL